MGFRETLNRNKKLALLVAGVIVIGSVGFAAFYSSREFGNPLTGAGKAFYSIDDGKTFFTDDSMKIPPFTHEGKPAVQAMVYTADGGKTRFVGYLMRFTPTGQEKLQKLRAAAQANQNARPGIDPELQANTEVKKPGAGEWIKLSNISATAEVMTVRVPGDPTRLADPVDP